jgi:Holliday junction resolvase RusA-like endonuclease
MTQRDVWKKRPAVVRYRAFCDDIRAYAAQLGFEFPACGAEVVFHIPMPVSWSKKKRREMEGKPHQQKPDLDNCLKALKDALLEDDSVVWHLSSLEKRWSTDGRIVVTIYEANFF